MQFSNPILRAIQKPKQYLAFIRIRASYKDFGHFHSWKFIQIIFSNLGNWFTSLFPQWKLIPRGIPSIGKLILRAISTFGHWLQVWFPSVEINSYNYFQTFLLELVSWTSFTPTILQPQSRRNGVLSHKIYFLGIKI